MGVTVGKMSGDHRFDKNYQGVVRRILDQLPRRRARHGPGESK